MMRFCTLALTVGSLIIIAASAGAMMPSRAKARGYVGPAPSSTHEESAGPAFGYVEHPQGYVERSRFSRHAFGSVGRVRRKQ